MLSSQATERGYRRRNVLKWGTGALNIDASRIGDNGGSGKLIEQGEYSRRRERGWGMRDMVLDDTVRGRWPANVIHDGSEEVTARFPKEAGAFAPVRGTEPSKPAVNVYGEYKRVGSAFHNDSGSAARFFYTAKADVDDRLGSKHPTIKPLDLMRYLIKLVTPKGGTVLDCFAGSGTTGEAAYREGMRAVLIEREAEYVEDIRKRLQIVKEGSFAREITRNRARNEQDTGYFFE